MEVSTHHQHPDHQLKTSNLRKYDEIDSKTHLWDNFRLRTNHLRGPKVAVGGVQLADNFLMMRISQLSSSLFRQSHNLSSWVLRFSDLLTFRYHHLSSNNSFIPSFNQLFIMLTNILVLLAYGWTQYRRAWWNICSALEPLWTGISKEMCNKNSANPCHSKECQTVPRGLTTDPHHRIDSADPALQGDDPLHGEQGRGHPQCAQHHCLGWTWTLPGWTSLGGNLWRLILPHRLCFDLLPLHLSDE